MQIKRLHENKKEFGGTAIRTRGFLHAKQTLYHWVTPPWCMEEENFEIWLRNMPLFSFVTSQLSQNLSQLT